MKKETRIVFERPFDRNELSEEVMAYAFWYYNKQIAKYTRLPWWKKMWQRKPTFVLKRIYDDLLVRPRIYHMELQTIDGTYSIRGVFDTGGSTEQLEKHYRFVAADLIKK